MLYLFKVRELKHFVSAFEGKCGLLDWEERVEEGGVGDQLHMLVGD